VTICLRLSTEYDETAQSDHFTLTPAPSISFFDRRYPCVRFMGTQTDSSIDQLNHNHSNPLESFACFTERLEVNSPLGAREQPQMICRAQHSESLDLEKRDIPRTIHPVRILNASTINMRAEDRRLPQY
jgi:hypothetical protein